MSQLQVIILLTAITGVSGAYAIERGRNEVGAALIVAAFLVLCLAPMIANH